MTRRIVTILLAAVLAAAGVASVLVYVRGADQRALNGHQAVGVYVAAQRIPAGTTLGKARSDGLIVSRQYPAEAVPAEARFTFSPDMDTLVASTDIGVGQLVTQPMWITQTNSALAGLSIPTGMMAFSFKVPEEQRDGGVWQSGAEIAIFSTHKLVAAKNGTQVAVTVGGGDAALHITRLLLPRVKLISIVSYGGDQSSNRSTSTSTNDAVKPVATGFAVVTVAVTQSDVEKLINATLLGNIDIALLTADSKVATGPGVNNSNLFN